MVARRRREPIRRRRPMSEPEPPRDRLQRLLDLVARLRSPEGCPWDREQELGDLRAYLLEEAHEVAAAIDGGDWSALEGELGDLLFMTAFVVRLGEEAGGLSMDEVVRRIEEKMIARHPHVFGDADLPDATAVRHAWERRKVRDRESTLLAGVPGSLPALVAAYRLTQKAAGVGFDWSGPAEVLDKIAEELAELRAELATGEGRGGDSLAEETGDLLFTVANLARQLGIDPEAALAAANRKFRQRFERIESGLAERGRSLDQATLEEMNGLWEAAKGGGKESD